jgi:hypothetical protein
LLGTPEELPPYFKIDEKGLIFFKDIIYILNHENLQEDIISDYHDVAAQGHMGID